MLLGVNEPWPWKENTLKRQHPKEDFSSTCWHVWCYCWDSANHSKHDQTTRQLHPSSHNMAFVFLDSWQFNSPRSAASLNAVDFLFLWCDVLWKLRFAKQGIVSWNLLSVFAISYWNPCIWLHHEMVPRRTSKSTKWKFVILVWLSSA